MDIQEDMLEEHLDDENQNCEMEREFAEIEHKIEELVKRKMSLNYDKGQQSKLEKAITLLRLHVQNYHRIVLYNRRRARQRLRRRQCTLRNFFLQSLMEMQIRFVEMLPLELEPAVILGTDNSNPQSEKQGLAEKNGSEEYFAKDVNFYKDVVLKYTNDQWLNTFHMSKNIFNLIRSRLETALGNIGMELETWIAMCIYAIASGSKCCYIAMLFNVEKDFVRQSLTKFSECLLNEFPEKMSMPSNKTELENISKGFQNASNMMPCVVGVLNLFKLPNICDCGRFSTCGAESIKVQICIDNSFLIRKVETTNHKPTMFLKSPNEISFQSKKLSQICVLPYFIVAPDNYPLRNWLMRKYNDPMQQWEYSFNKSCGSLHIYREVALKRLFGRWHILDSTECILPESKSLIVKACCLLHNILEENEEYFSLEWCINFDPAKYECRLTSAVTSFFNDSTSAIETRNLIAKCMALNIVELNN